MYKSCVCSEGSYKKKPSAINKNAKPFFKAVRNHSTISRTAINSSEHRLTISLERDHEDCKATRTFTQKIEKLKTFNHDGGGGKTVRKCAKVDGGAMHNQLGVQVQTRTNVTSSVWMRRTSTLYTLQCLVPHRILLYSVLVLTADYRHKQLRASQPSTIYRVD